MHHTGAIHFAIISSLCSSKCPQMWSPATQLPLVNNAPPGRSRRVLNPLCCECWCGRLHAQIGTLSNSDFIACFQGLNDSFPRLPLEPEHQLPPRHRKEDSAGYTNAVATPLPKTPLPNVMADLQAVLAAVRNDRLSSTRRHRLKMHAMQQLKVRSYGRGHMSSGSVHQYPRFTF